MAAQYAYVMKDMTKSFPGAQKPVLNHINLQFYHGAKIGIVGPNGAGKSTLMKIMAGIDKDFQGEAWPGENVTVGYLPQEPQLDPSKNVLEKRQDGACEVGDMGERFNVLSAEMGDPTDNTNSSAHGGNGRTQGQINPFDEEPGTQLQVPRRLSFPPSDVRQKLLGGKSPIRLTPCDQKP